jgi:hypothetical protein
VAESERAALLASNRSRTPFVGFLVAEEFGSHALPSDCGIGIGSMLRATRVDYIELRVAERKDARAPPERIPDLLDKLKSLTDGQPINVDNGEDHALKSVGWRIGTQPPTV